jgi:Putative restriction endonuclease
MTVLKRDTLYHTYADYVTWSGSYGDELIDGTAYVREPPAPSWLHQGIVGELYRQVANALEDKPCRVRVAPLDVRLPKSTEEDDQVDTVVQPDVLIVSDLSLRRDIADARPFSNSKDKHSSLPFPTSSLIGPACWPVCRKQRRRADN